MQIHYESSCLIISGSVSVFTDAVPPVNEPFSHWAPCRETAESRIDFLILAKSSIFQMGAFKPPALETTAENQPKEARSLALMLINVWIVPGDINSRKQL